MSLFCSVDLVLLFAILFSIVSGAAVAALASMTESAGSLRGQQGFGGRHGGAPGVQLKAGGSTVVPIYKGFAIFAVNVTAPGLT